MILFPAFWLSATAQDKEKYILTPAPDVWYNDVDGIRLGLRLNGEMDGTFNDGPHRLDVGIWGGLWFPDHPISYYVSFTEPINKQGDSSNEASVQAISSVRTGYSQHRVQFNKRWQRGFDELNYLQIHLFFSSEELFESEYRPYSYLWQKQNKSLLGLNGEFSANPSFGRFNGSFSALYNAKEANEFSVLKGELIQKIEMNPFSLRLRAFAGFSSEGAAPEYRFLSSMESPQYWLDKGITRAKGTIPEPWLQGGNIHATGGANLRGYVSRDIRMLNSTLARGLQLRFPLYESIIALNTDVEFPNPINNYIKRIAVVGDLIEARTYFFFDIGKGNNYTTIKDPEPDGFPDIAPPLVPGASAEPEVLANLGTGVQFSINIPDYLGKDRGIFVRYDVPFWLSDPDAGDNNFKYRHVIGVGAIFPF